MVCLFLVLTRNDCCLYNEFGNTLLSSLKSRWYEVQLGRPDLAKGQIYCWFAILIFGCTGISLIPWVLWLCAAIGLAQEYSTDILVCLECRSLILD